MRRKFREARKARGKTQHDMSVDLAISESYVRHIEAGRRTPATDTAIRIARYLGLTVEELFT